MTLKFWNCRERVKHHYVGVKVDGLTKSESQSEVFRSIIYTSKERFFLHSFTSCYIKSLEYKKKQKAALIIARHKAKSRVLPFFLTHIQARKYKESIDSPHYSSEYISHINLHKHENRIKSKESNGSSIFTKKDSSSFI